MNLNLVFKSSSDNFLSSTRIGNNLFRKEIRKVKNTRTRCFRRKIGEEYIWQNRILSSTANINCFRFFEKKNK